MEGKDTCKKHAASEKNITPEFFHFNIERLEFCEGIKFCIEAFYTI